MVKQDTGVVGVSGRMKRLMEVDDLIWQPLKVSAETIRSSSCSNSDNNSKKKKTMLVGCSKTQLKKQTVQICFD